MRAPANLTKVKGPQHPLDADVAAVLAPRKRLGAKRTRDGMAQYGIPSDKAIGMPVGALQ